MKILSLLLLLSTAAFASETKVVQVQPDQETYNVGARAVVFFQAIAKPQDQTELFMRLEHGEEEINVVPISPFLSAAFLPAFTQPEKYDLNLRVYQQNILTQRQVENGIAAYNKKIQTTQALLDSETDPSHRAILEAQLAKYQSEQAALKEALENNRTLLEVQHVSITVLPGAANVFTAPGIFTVKADKNPPNYLVGETAVFSVKLLTQFKGPDGPREHIFTGDLNGVAVSPVLSGTQYVFTAPVFTSADVGAKTFTANLSIRSKRQADRLRDAIFQAVVARSDYTELRDASTQEAEKAYYQAKIDSLNQAIAAFNAQLGAILTPVTSGTLNVTVN